MWYWNQDNFEGLAQIAAYAAETQHLTGFAQYCHARVQGLRRQAFLALESFIEEVLGWPEDEQRRFVDWICRTQIGSPRIHHLIPHRPRPSGSNGRRETA